MECSILDRFPWSLRELDETDIESLIPFVFRFPEWKAEQRGGGKREEQLYADQADWL